MSDDNPTTDDPEFFLRLARPHSNSSEARAEARERWNTWRRDPANDGVSVTFEEADFTIPQNSAISFEGFEFGDDANFSNIKFQKKIKFSYSIFGRDANFSRTIFGIATIFDKTVFGNNANFSETFFRFRAIFRCATFADNANFTNSIFGPNTLFLECEFGMNANFSSASFDIDANFERSIFGRNANFSGKQTEIDSNNLRIHWNRITPNNHISRENQYRKRRDEYDFGPSKFSEISFAGVRFRGDISFSGRSFERVTNFTNVEFETPPDFDGASNVYRIDFTGAHVRFAPKSDYWLSNYWLADSTTSIRLRTLRSMIEATKNHDFERDLYIEERKAERGIFLKLHLARKDYPALAAHIGWICIMAVYSTIADYGRSFARPAITLLLSIKIFAGLYSLLLADKREMAGRKAHDAITSSHVGTDALPAVRTAAAKSEQTITTYDSIVSQLALSNAVPFVGPLTIDADAKKFLLCGEWPKPAGAATTSTEVCIPIPPPGYQLAMISQNTLSIILVFFIGLALRNYFRVK